MNPFEIRFNLLQLARDTLVEAWHVQNDHLNQKWHMELEYAKTCNHPAPVKPELLPYPSAAEIMAETEKLYEFVSRKQ